MFSKTFLIASAAAATLVAVPGAAEAGHRYNGYSQYGQQAYDYGYQQPYQQRYYGQQGYYGQQQRYYGQQGYYGQQQRYYGQQGNYGQQRAYYGGRRQRCGKGTTGLIVGGAAGALLGREVGRGSSRNRYYGNRNSGTTGAILGGAIGALVGRQVARSC